MASERGFLAVLRGFVGALRERTSRRRERWENLCTQCGLCCYEKDISPGGQIFINLNAPCPYLDEETKLCRVYQRRFRVFSECRKVRLYHALFSRYMPESCGYVRHYRRWRIFGFARLKR